MFAATQQQQQQHHHQPQPQQQNQKQQQEQEVPKASTSTAQEEALKRNTDCVYFLASPLTCKKGSECEYRHSEFARLNPRDCWYWLNGNCLNAKCSFRHPPLDAALGTQAAPSPGSSLPLSQAAATPAAQAPYGSSKQAVPCIFYQKGLCLKGDRCAFLHGPNPTTGNKVPQMAAATHVTEPPALKKTFGGLEKFTQEQKIPQVNVSKSVAVPPGAKPALKAEAAFPRNVVGVERNVPPPTRLDDEVSRYKATNVPPVINGNSVSRSNRSQQAPLPEDYSFPNGKDGDEFLRESSPGFDVLVDNELGDSDYYHGEDQFGRTRGHEGRNLNSVNEYDMGHSADYNNSMTDVDRERFPDPRGHGSYDHMQGQYAWEQHRASSERMLVEPAHLERRRGYHKSDSPDHIDNLDLRHHLSKQRRGNGLRSIVSHAHNNHVEERSYRSSSRRDALHLPPNESSLGNRLRGRIKLPGRSPVNGSDLRPERDLDRGRNWDRLSPGRPQISHQGRLRDRIKGRVQEDINVEGRNFNGPRTWREITDENSDFARPKSLAELKVVKNADGKELQSLGKRKNLEDYQQSEGDLKFEGPKPLSEILKRKRGADAGASGSDKSSGYKEDNNQREIQENLISGSEGTAGAYTQRAKEEAIGLLFGDEEESAVGTVTENIDEAPGQPSQAPDPNDFEAEDGMIYDENIEDQELEVDQRDGDYEYEQVEDGEYTYEEGENAEEYLDEEEDGDDFAKKIGVMIT
ncbi:zinc finger CCCH domain-containing protein 17 [Fagus crenata]